MDRLIYFFVSFVDRVRSLVGLVIPIFAEASDFRNWSLWVKVLVHIIILGCIIVGLYYLTPYLDSLLRVRAPDTIRKIYLPVVFFLIYLLSWVAYFIWQVLNRSEITEFPEIEKAWYDALARLNDAGYRLTEFPLFLIIGKPTSDVDGLFLASKLKIEVRAPTYADAPIRLFASRDAIFVTCGGASGLGRFADALSDTEMVAVGNEPGANTKTINPEEAIDGVDPVSRQEFFRLLALQSERQLTDAEELQLRELGDIIKLAGAKNVRRINLSNADAILGPKQLAFLCQLITRDRKPECPINGVMAIVPWAALESDESTRLAITTMATDLSTTRTAFAQCYVQYVMITDLEESRGFQEFRKGFSSDMLKQRMGQRLPVLPDEDPDDLPALYEKAADWVRLNVLASFVIKFLRLDWPPEGRNTNQFIPSYNRNLFLFLHELYERGPRLGTLLARGVPGDTLSEDRIDAYPLLGGCYLAATGRDQKDHAFAAGVFDRLTDTQNDVRWSSMALQEDASYKRMALSFYLAALLLALPTAYAIYLLVTASGK